MKTYPIIPVIEFIVGLLGDNLEIIEKSLNDTDTLYQIKPNFSYKKSIIPADSIIFFLETDNECTLIKNSNKNATLSIEYDYYNDEDDSFDGFIRELCDKISENDKIIKILSEHFGNDKELINNILLDVEGKDPIIDIKVETHGDYKLTDFFRYKKKNIKSLKSFVDENTLNVDRLMLKLNSINYIMRGNDSIEIEFKLEAHHINIYKYQMYANPNPLELDSYFE